MTALWDTNVASRVRPETVELAYVEERAAAGRPVTVAAATVSEVTYGIQKGGGDEPQFVRLLLWFSSLVDSGTLSVVPFDGEAAIVAGRVRAVCPHAPPNQRRDQRSRTMRQASWLMDVQVAATAFAAGVDVVTDNRADFARLGEVLSGLYPTAPALEVVESPFG